MGGVCVCVRACVRACACGRACVCVCVWGGVSKCVVRHLPLVSRKKVKAIVQKDRWRMKLRGMRPRQTKPSDDDELMLNVLRCQLTY